MVSLSPTSSGELLYLGDNPWKVCYSFIGESEREMVELRLYRYCVFCAHERYDTDTWNEKLNVAGQERLTACPTCNERMTEEKVQKLIGPIIYCEGYVT